MLADEITADLRADPLRTPSATRGASAAAVTRSLTSKGISYGSIRARSDGSVDTSGVRGVDPDLRVRPFFMHGETISIREFLVGAFNAEMGLEAADPDLRRAAGGRTRRHAVRAWCSTASTDRIEAPPADSATDDPDGDGVVNEVPDEHRGLHGVLPAPLLQGRHRGAVEQQLQRGQDLFRRSTATTATSWT